MEVSFWDFPAKHLTLRTMGAWSTSRPMKTPEAVNEQEGETRVGWGGQQLFINLLQLNPLKIHFAHIENPYGAD